jgi:hypothetical protein
MKFTIGNLYYIRVEIYDNTVALLSFSDGESNVLPIILLILHLIFYTFLLCQNGILGGLILYKIDLIFLRKIENMGYIIVISF